jgi:transposase
MANVLRPEKQEQVRALGRLGWSLRRIQRETDVDRASVRRYLTEAGITVREPRRRRPPAVAGSKPASQVTTDPGADSKPASQVFPGSDALATGVRDQCLTSAAKSACEPHRDFVAAALDLGRNGKAIWQDLVDRHGFTGHYESVKRFIRRLRPSSLIAHPRMETAPGEEGQVDYGTGPMVRHPVTGKYRRTRLFALTLACSRKAVWLLTWKSSTQQWCELHEEAFRRLGGAPRTMVLDNLKEGVLEPDVYDPTINPLYRDMLAHYGVTALPARVGHPDRKGKVESTVGYAQRTALAGMRFESLEEAQRYLDGWTERWADTRIHGTRKRQVAAMFAEEQPSLLPLPTEPFRYYQHAVRVVHLDGCIEVAKGYYATRPGWVGREVHVRWDSRCVRILDPQTGQLLREHLRTQPGHFRIDEQDRSPRTPPQIEQLLRRARVAGKHVALLCEQIEQRRDQWGARQILGVLSLVKKHGFAAIDDHCRIALEAGVATYRLVSRLAKRPRAETELLHQTHDLIRQLNHYSDVIRRKTEPETHEPDRTRSLPSQAAPLGDGRDSAGEDPASPDRAHAAARLLGHAGA